MGQFDAKFYVEGLRFAPGNGYTTTVPLGVFTQRNFVPDFIRLKLNFIPKKQKVAFEPPFGGLRDLGVTYALHL